MKKSDNRISITVLQEAIEEELIKVVAAVKEDGTEELHHMLAYHMGWEGEGAVNEYGPAIMTAMHSVVDGHLEYGDDPPEFLRPIWEEYMALHMSRPAAERQKMMHQSHNAYVAPDERRFVKPEVIKRFCIVGQPAEVLEQVRELERKGVRQLMCNFTLERGYQMVRDYAKNIIQKL